MIEKISEDLSMEFPFEPDMIQAYKFGLCQLCEKERSRDRKFDNSTCPHCKNLTKTMWWVKEFGVLK